MVVNEEMKNANSDEYLTEGIFDVFKWMKGVLKKGTQLPLKSISTKLRKS